MARQASNSTNLKSVVDILLVTVMLALAGAAFLPVLWHGIAGR
jgi:hypothetical protein